MSSPTIYMITGANRGIGKGFVVHYLAQPNNLVIACVRNPVAASHLLTLPKGEGSQLIIAKIDALSYSDAAAAIQKLETEHHINKIDIIISSTGIAKMNRIESLPIQELQEHVDTTAIAPLLLFQAAYTLLKASSAPKFVLIGATAGTFSQIDVYPYPNSSYAISKIMAHWLVRKMLQENEWLVSFSIHPGLVQTDMGNMGARAFGKEKADVTIEDSITRVAKAINETTREYAAGTLHDFEGKVIPW